MRLLISILVFVLVLAATFCVGVFISWDFDLPNWQPEERFVVAVFGWILAATSALIAWKVVE